ncbi:MAG: adenine deaminase C-terminal domain-containing protein, partial [Bacteroidales bacterium]
EGHLDNCVRTCIRNGIHPVDAICMATINTAECIRRDELYGSVAPGKIADIVLVNDLVDFHADTVIANGRVVSRDGKLIKSFERVPYPESAYNTVRLKKRIQASDFVIACTGDVPQKVRVIGCSNEGIITSELHAELIPKNGVICANTGKDILKITSLERTQLTGDMYTALIHGFGLKSGAIASTYNPHNQHMTVVGTNDEDMAYAANVLAEIGGGFIVVENREVKAKLPLPMYGLLSDMPLEKVVEGVRAVYSAAWDMGCNLSEPFHTLAFVGLPVIIGNLKISPTGLVDVWAEKNVPLFLENK